MRLVNSSIESEGRVEVCLNGVWGTVNTYFGWSYFDAYFVCTQLNLGSSKIKAIAYTATSKFGDGLQPQVMTDLTCTGLEYSITDCFYVSYGNHSIYNGVSSVSIQWSRAYTAGVACFDGKPIITHFQM